MAKSLKLTLLLLITLLVGQISVEYQADTSNVGDIWISSPDHSPSPGESFRSAVTINLGSQPLGGYEVTLNYDQSVVNIVSITAGESTPFIGYTFSNSAEYNTGQTKIVAFQNISSTSPTGVVELAYVDFTVVGGSGESSVLGISVDIIVSTSGANISNSPIDGSVTIGPVTTIQDWWLY